jgi:hypothetical protein
VREECSAEKLKWSHVKSHTHTLSTAVELASE